MTVHHMKPHAEAATEAEPRPLLWRYHLIRPTGGGLALTEFLIEEQLTLAHEYGTPVTVFGDVTPEIAAQVETLFDLADAVYDAEFHESRAEYHARVDDYATQLARLARLVRDTR